MTTTTTSIASILNGLIETCKDGQYGFGSAADTVKNADYQALFTELATQRQLYGGELQTLVGQLGEEVEHSGSLAGTLHRGWIDIKAALSNGDEHSILAECERGEDSAVAQYRDALDHPELPASVRAILQRQAEGVQSAHDRVRDLRDRTATS
jgi:uncharacterized protein (TIGR02284 family)